MGNKYKKFAAARADMLPIKVQILNYFTNFKDKSTDRMPNVVVDLPDLRIPKYFSHSVSGCGSFIWKPKPLAFWLIKAEYQGFQMRYITFLYDNWFLRYEPSKLNDRKKSPISLVKRVFFSIVQL